MAIKFKNNLFKKNENNVLDIYAKCTLQEHNSLKRNKRTDVL
jgi:hypothetical protein